MRLDSNLTTRFMNHLLTYLVTSDGVQFLFVCLSVYMVFLNKNKI